MIKFKEDIISGTYDNLALFTKNKENKIFLNTPIEDLNSRYKDILGDTFSLNGKEQKIDYNKQTLQQIIDQYLIDYDYEQEIISDPYFIVLDSDKDIFAGFITFVFKDKNYIEDILLFSFDANNKSFSRQIYIDFDKLIRKFLKDGISIHWCCLSRNNANKNYERLVQKYSGFSKNSDERSDIIEYTILTEDKKK